MSSNSGPEAEDVVLYAFVRRMEDPVKLIEIFLPDRRLASSESDCDRDCI